MSFLSGNMPMMGSTLIQNQVQVSSRLEGVGGEGRKSHGLKVGCSWVE